MIELAAYSDDSASDAGDQRLFVAGYLNNKNNWDMFDIAWREELAGGRPIDYLKMTEANGLRGQFKDWARSDRDEKLSGLVRIIRHFEPLSYEFSLSRKQHREIAMPELPRAMNPHFIATFGVVASVTRYVAENSTQCRIEFTFDEQEGVSEDIGLLFDRMALNLPHRARKLVAGRPRYLSDRDTPALQAADMLAWHLRREYESGEGIGTNAVANLLRNDKGHLSTAVDDDILRRWAIQMAQLPELKTLQSKGQWQDFRETLRNALAAGYHPPHGTRLRNFLFALRDRVRR